MSNECINCKVEIVGGDDAGIFSSLVGWQHKDQGACIGQLRRTIEDLRQEIDHYAAYVAANTPIPPGVSYPLVGHQMSTPLKSVPPTLPTDQASWDAVASLISRALERQKVLWGRM